MKRENEVLCKVFETLKDEKTIAEVTSLGNLEDGYGCLKDKLGSITETEYKQAINTIKENNGTVNVYSDEEMELSNEELEKIGGGSMPTTYQTITVKNAD